MLVSASVGRGGTVDDGCSLLRVGIASVGGSGFGEVMLERIRYCYCMKEQ